MNQDFKVITRRVIADRPLAALIVVLTALTLVFCVYVVLRVEPSDLQLAVRYTAFGETNYYRDRWYYLLSFIGFGIICLLLNVALSVKVFLLEKRLFALIALGFGFVMLGMTFIITRSVLGIALL